MKQKKQHDMCICDKSDVLLVFRRSAIPSSRTVSRSVPGGVAICVRDDADHLEVSSITFAGVIRHVRSVPA